MSTTIESDGNTALRVFLSRSSVIGYFIQENDKTPAWDGSLILYKIPDHNSNKKHIAGAVPIQVKSTKRSPDARETFDFDITDLRLYAAHGGILFLRPIFELVDKPRIFGKVLLPLVIERYLKKAHPSQKTIGIELEEFQTVQDLEIRMQHFVENSPIFHHPRYPINISTIETEKQPLIIKTLAPPANPISGLFSDNTVVYAQMADGSLWPTDLQVAAVELPQSQPIHVNGEVFFNEWMTQYDSDGNQSWTLNDCLKLQNDKDDLQLHISITDHTKLHSILEAVDFCQAILKNGCFSVGASRFPLKRLEDLEKITGEVRIPKIRSIERFCHEFHLDFSEVTVRDTEDYRSDLNILMPAIINKKVISLHNESRDQFMIVRDVFRSPILLYCQKQGNAGYSIQDYFSAIPSGNLCVTIQDETIPCNRFIGLTSIVKDPKMLTALIIPYIQDIYDEITASYHPLLWPLYNHFFLACIHGFDLKNNIAFLQLAEQLTTLQPKNTDEREEHINAINRMQIARRQRPLRSEEIDLLVKIREKQGDDYTIQCAIALLLGNVTEFELHFQRLSETKQAYFKTYPIYNLYSKARQEEKISLS